MRSRRASTFATKTLLTLYGPEAFTARSPWYQPASARCSSPPKASRRWWRYAIPTSDVAVGVVLHGVPDQDILDVVPGRRAGAA